MASTPIHDSTYTMDDDWWDDVSISGGLSEHVERTGLIADTQDRAILMGDVATSVKVGEERQSRQPISQQALKAAKTYLINGQVAPSSHEATYGSNEDVYNPYRPWTSREYIAQEFAAERLQQVKIPRSHLLPLRDLQDLSSVINTFNPTFATDSTSSETTGKAVLEAQHVSPYPRYNSVPTTAAMGILTDTEESEKDDLPGKFDDISSHALHYYGTTSFSEMSSGYQKRLGQYAGEDAMLLHSGLSSASQKNGLKVERDICHMFRQARSTGYPRLHGQRLRRRGWFENSFSKKVESSTKLRSTLTATQRRLWRLRHCSSLNSRHSLGESSDFKRRRVGCPFEVIPIHSSPLSLFEQYSQNLGYSSLVTFPGSQVNGAKSSSYITREELRVDAREQQAATSFESHHIIRLKDNHLSHFQSPSPSTTIVDTSPASCVFTSELIPRQFSRSKRLNILHILHTKAPYLPLAITPDTQLYISQRDRSISHDDSNAIVNMSQNIANPMRAVPLEIFENIASHLPSDDLKTMRFVSHDFESKVSRLLFRSVVVSFRPDVYGMRPHESRGISGVDRTGEAQEAYSNAVKAHNGMKIFEAWGPHVKRFAMTCELSEDQLQNPPPKDEFEVFDAFWGQYEWPYPNYHRFVSCADLENKADEFQSMSAAFSNLHGLKEIGIYMESGLGWLAGPDISDRAQLFQRKAVFGARPAQHKEQLRQRQAEWNSIVRSLSWHFLRWPLVFQGVDLAMEDLDTRLSIPYNPADDDYVAGYLELDFSTAPIVPKKLTAAQLELLLETGWAQQAFLSSWCMALSDNCHTFESVQTLNIAQLASKHISGLEREDIWKALPNLSNLILIVAADFRIIYKHASGKIEAYDIEPSEAASMLYHLLKNFVSKVKNIKTMKLGYLGGGEHQTGLFGRNKLILPAPLADYKQAAAFVANGGKVLHLPYVEDFSLTNCWIDPLTLQDFVGTMKGANMHFLTLHSVSLTAHPGDTVFVEPDPSTNGVSYSHLWGHRRSNDNNVNDKFYAQRPRNSDPNPANNADTWAHTAGRIGSWPNVIDAVSPGPSLDFIRYAFHYREDPPPKRNPGALELIKFSSCGYVKLQVIPQILNQTCLPDLCNDVPECLQERYSALTNVMMAPHDELLGQIVPSLPELDTNTFQTGFPMKLGWGKRDQRRFYNLEDGQPKGGSGRFTGSVGRLPFGKAE